MLGEKTSGERGWGDGFLWLFVLGLVLAMVGGPMSVVESKNSWGFRVFLWFCIRGFWFGAGALTYYLCTR